MTCVTNSYDNNNRIIIQKNKFKKRMPQIDSSSIIEDSDPRKAHRIGSSRQTDQKNRSPSYLKEKEKEKEESKIQTQWHSQSHRDCLYGSHFRSISYLYLFALCFSSCLPQLTAFLGGSLKLETTAFFNVQNDYDCHDCRTCTKMDFIEYRGKSKASINSKRTFRNLPNKGSVRQTFLPLFATSTSSPSNTQTKQKATTASSLTTSKSVEQNKDSSNNNQNAPIARNTSSQQIISPSSNPPSTPIPTTTTNDASPLSQSLQRQQQNFNLRNQQEQQNRPQTDDISHTELAKQIQQINSLTTLSSLEEIQAQQQLYLEKVSNSPNSPSQQQYLSQSNMGNINNLQESIPSMTNISNQYLPSVVTGGEREGKERGEEANNSLMNDNKISSSTNMLKQAYEECKRITSIYAKTFFLGTSFLEHDKRYATWAIYVWCRRTDDIVDSPRALLEHTMEQDLNSWMTRLTDLWEGRPWDSLDAALSDSIQKYPSMSIKPFIDMVDGMVMDIPGHQYGQMRYETFEELYLYCYRVAGTVGFMTLPIMGTAPGYTIQQAAEPALALGIALQLTNILRDVGEDATRGRIYLPLEDLRRFEVTEDQIMNRIMNSNYRDLIKFEIKRAREYYDLAETGIPMLAPDARLPVRASLDMYRKILDAIEENDYDNFKQRAYVSKFEKMVTLPLSWLKCRDII